MYCLPQESTTTTRYLSDSIQSCLFAFSFLFVPLFSGPFPLTLDLCSTLASSPSPALLRIPCSLHRRFNQACESIDRSLLEHRQSSKETDSFSLFSRGRTNIEYIIRERKGETPRCHNMPFAHCPILLVFFNLFTSFNLSLYWCFFFFFYFWDNYSEKLVKYYYLNSQHFFVKKFL